MKDKRLPLGHNLPLSYPEGDTTVLIPGRFSLNVDALGSLLSFATVSCLIFDKVKYSFAKECTT